MIDYDKFPEYRKGLRPVQPESLPAFVDQELTRISAVLGELVAAVKSLNTRVTTLEP